MTIPKTEQELADMKEGGEKLGRILAELLDAAKPGVSLLSLEDLAQRRIREAGGTPSFQTVQGYHWATCLCVNEVVVHGVPSKYVLGEGDVLTVDIGLLYKGLHTDTAWTKIIKSGSGKIKSGKEKEKFLEVGERALWAAIAIARMGNRIGHISEVIQTTVEQAGYSIVRSLVGHGVGKELHELPQVPGFVRGATKNTPLLSAGMTIAIEVIYAMGKGDVVYENDDGWSIATRDRSLSAVFEHTVAITQKEPFVLTKWGK